MKTSKVAQKPRQLTGLELVLIGLFFIGLRIASGHLSALLLEQFVLYQSAPVVQSAL